MVVTLAANVARDWIEIAWAERLGPVSVLPSKTMRRAAVVVQLMGGCAFEMPHELSQRHARGEPNDDVHVIGGAPRGKHHAAELAGLSAHDREKALVERGGQDGTPSRAGPNDVNEDERGRASRHCLFSTDTGDQLRSCVRDASYARSDAQQWGAFNAGIRDPFSPLAT